MPKNPRNFLTDLRGAGGLTVDAISGVTDIVESLHQTIATSAGIFDAEKPSRTRGIPRLVYQSIRVTSGLVGEGLDAVLGQLSLMVGEKESPPARETSLAILNGLLGDHLVARNNPLAIPMQLRHDGECLTNQMLAELWQSSAGHMVIMVHGAFMNDRNWERKEHDHGQALARDLGLVPLYLHYNTGLHISENGRNFADLLQATITQLPQPVTLSMIGYSMGGLVARSACYYGQRAGHTWLKSLQKLLFLGTPHHGTPLEKGGNLINTLMDISPYSAPFARLGRMRSSGVTDLRYGNVVDEDWLDRDRFEAGGDQRIPVALPEGVQCYAIAASTSKKTNNTGNNLVGDGLVPIDSALGRHKDAQMNLLFPESQQWIGRNMKHLDLLNNPEVYETVKLFVSQNLSDGQAGGAARRPYAGYD